MRSSSTCSAVMVVEGRGRTFRPGRWAARLVAGIALLVAVTACAGGPAGTRPAGELINPLLGPGYAQWLVGAVGKIAEPDEVSRYLALDSDFAAADFIEAFWARRDPDPSTPGNPVEETFEARAREADQRFREAGLSGHKTARGTIYVLYGQPTRTDFELPRRGGPAVEVWFYADDAPPGLDGRRPDGSYRFQKIGDVTGFYRPGARPQTN